MDCISWFKCCVKRIFGSTKNSWIWRLKRKKANLYRSCVCRTLLYGRELWTLSSVQEKSINAFHPRCLRCILRIEWQQKITNEEVLRRTSLTTVYFTLSQCKFGWLDHFLRMGTERIPKSLSIIWRVSRWLTQRFKDVCKHDQKA